VRKNKMVHGYYSSMRHCYYCLGYLPYCICYQKQQALTQQIPQQQIPQQVVASQPNKCGKNSDTVINNKKQNSNIRKLFWYRFLKTGDLPFGASC